MGEIVDTIAELSLQAKAAWAVMVAAAAFFLKLLRDFVVEKVRQATGLRIVSVYIRVAVAAWKADGVDPVHTKDERLARPQLAAVVSRITEEAEGAEEDKEGFTPYIPFCRHDDLSVDDVREWLGFLDSATLERIVHFIQSEALVHALAEDFRSEYVRCQFKPDRKVSLIKQYNTCVYEACEWGVKAIDKLEPLEHCPRLFWYLPVGNFVRRVIGRMKMWLCQYCQRAWARSRQGPELDGEPMQNTDGEVR